MSIDIVIYFLEFFTALIATITWKKYKLTEERNFVYFFWVVFIFDIIGTFFGSFFEINNAPIYNVLFIFYFSFFIYWYSLLLNFRKKRAYIFILYFLFVGFIFFKQNFFETLQSIHFVIGSILVLFLALLYFYQILQSDAIFKIKNSLPFWLTIGNIIYFVGILPLTMLQEHLNVRELTYNIVLTFINLITYSCYILGFLWMKKKFQAFK